MKIFDASFRHYEVVDSETNELVKSFFYFSDAIDFLKVQEKDTLALYEWGNLVELDLSKL